MAKQEYIMVGTKTVSKEVFRSVLRPVDNYNFIPNGGFWACEYNKLHISDWFEYLISAAQELIAYKDITSGILFTLKDDAKILTINSIEALRSIIDKYPSYHHLLNYYGIVTDLQQSINFELLSKDYDGIFVNYANLVYPQKTVIFDSWTVSTLLLFNLDAIESYKKVNINFLLPDSYFYYLLEEDKEVCHVEEESIYHKELSDHIRVLFNELASSKNIFSDYDEYFSHLVYCTNKSIEIAMNNNLLHLAKSIKEQLKARNIEVSEYIIIRNVATSVLSSYLRDNVDRERNLPKSNLKKIKVYPIEQKIN